jgi:hypothetical protein
MSSAGTILGSLPYWMAYYRLEPFGEEPAWLRAGIIASTTANCHRGRSQKAWTPADFIPNFLPKAKQTVRDIRKGFEALTLLLGGRVPKKNGRI